MARGIYRSGNVRGVDVPSVGFQQYKAQASLFSDLEQRINSIREFAIKAGTEESIERGKAFALENPVSYSDYINADPVERERLLSDGKFTAYDKAVRATRTNLLTSEIESVAINQLNLERKAAMLNIGTENEISLDELQNSMAGSIDGYVESLEADPDAAMALYSSLTTKANTIYKDYSDKITEYALEDIKLVTVAASQNALELIPSYVGQNSIDDEGNVTTWKQQLDLVKNSTINKLIKARVSPTQLTKFITDWENKTQEAIQTKLYDRYVNTDFGIESVENANIVVDNFEKQIFPDSVAQSLYDNLTDKASFQDEVEDWRDAIVANKNAVYTETERVAKADVAGLNNLIDVALSEGDLDTLDRTIEVLKDKAKKDPANYSEAYSDAIDLVGPVRGNSMIDEYSRLENGIYSGDITRSDINIAAQKGLITRGLNSELSRLLSLLESQQDEAMIEAKNMIRQNLSLPLLDTSGNVMEDNILTLDDDERIKARAEVAAAMVKIDTWRAQNEDYTANQLLSYTQELINAPLLLQEQEANATKVYSEVNTMLQSTKIKKLFRDHWDRDFSGLKSYIGQDEDKLDTVIRVLNEMSEYSHGGKYLNPNTGKQVKFKSQGLSPDDFRKAADYLAENRGVLLYEIQ